jgi:adenylate cyclase
VYPGCVLPPLRQEGQAVRQHERRSGARVFFGRDHRRHHHLSSKVSQLLVIARNSAFTYKRRAVKVQQIGTELGVQYVVEGSVRRVGNRVRITSQLVEAATGGHLWADRFDRDLTDIFAVQDEVTREIVSSLALKLTVDEQGRLRRTRIQNMEAYDFLLRGREAWWRHNREANSEAQAMFERTVQLAQGFHPPIPFSPTPTTRIM